MLKLFCVLTMNLIILIVILHFSDPRYYHWWKLGKGHIGDHQRTAVLISNHEEPHASPHWTRKGNAFIEKTRKLGGL